MSTTKQNVGGKIHLYLGLKDENITDSQQVIKDAHESIKKTLFDNKTLKEELKISKINHEKAIRLNRKSKYFLIGFVVPMFKKRMQKAEGDRARIYNTLEGTNIQIDIAMKTSVKKALDALFAAFGLLLSLTEAHKGKTLGGMVSEQAYMMADDMLKAREQTQPYT